MYRRDKELEEEIKQYTILAAWFESPELIMAKLQSQDGKVWSARFCLNRLIPRVIYQATQVA
jgi:hypothetical protein